MRNLKVLVMASLAATLAPGMAWATTTLPVNFWGNGLTVQRVEKWLEIVNSVFNDNGAQVQFTLAGVGPQKLSCSEVHHIDGMNVLFVPSEQIPGGLEVADANALPLGVGSGFCTQMADYLVAATSHDDYTARVLSHAFGHNLGLGHTPGTIMSTLVEGHRNFEGWQVGILNEASLQAASATRAGTGGLLLGGRFTVQASWRTPAGDEGNGIPVALTGESGYLWFFGPENVEVTVKVLNACVPSLGNKFWVFAAGMTNVEVTLTVTDTQADTVKTYLNPMGTLFLPIADTGAFNTCP